MHFCNGEVLYFGLVNECMHTVGTEKPWNLFIKNCVFILTHLNSSHLQSTLFDVIHLSRHFFPLLITVLNSLILMPFRAPAIFLSPLPHWQNIFFSGLFSSGETTTKSHLGRDQVNREGEAQGVMQFWVKNC